MALLLSLPLWATAKQVAGWVEMAVIQPGDLELRAKLDSGAETSSLHCVCSSTFEKDGEEWVRFTVQNWRGERVQMERPVVRRTKIKRHFGGSQERLVINLPICVGGVRKEREVNVVNREGLEYQLLIGRNFMAGDFLIDPAQKYLLTPSCADAPTQH
jgi:hypothetical protein